MHERRWKLRADTAVSGRAAFAGSEHDVGCMALNFSPVGACLAFPAGTTVPRYFDLVLGLEPAPSPVRVVWRQAERVGVAFQDARPHVPDVMPG
ncbi:PilZ domain-containing protein [Methylobacterium sp. OAE515]|uniref:PilZ domain-containing protein n=1 Tax=Methylobacterium sp. OAE515 TaxID=2817895 RepID=UPI001789BA2C